MRGGVGSWFERLGWEMVVVDETKGSIVVGTLHIWSLVITASDSCLRASRRGIVD